MLTKVEMVVQHIEGLIEDEMLSNRDRIPSLTKIMKEFQVSRDTVIRAYKELNNRGIINAVHGKGYFVTNKNIELEKNVFLLLDELSPYKSTLVKSIEYHLKSKGQCRIFFHHYDKDLFQRLIEEHRGQFTHYVISPIPGSKPISQSIEQLPENRVVILDRHDCVHSKWRFVGQEFLKDITYGLEQLSEKLKKYNRFVFVFPEPSFHPKELKTGFSTFCKKNKIDSLVVSDVSRVDLRRGDAYLVIDDTDLATIVKTTRQQNWKLGQDIGLISYNETPLKSVVSDGITTISTNFELMGKHLVEMIFDSKMTYIHNEAGLILRKSF